MRQSRIKALYKRLRKLEQKQFNYDDRLFAYKLKQEDSIYKLKNSINELQNFDEGIMKKILIFSILLILIILFK
jgi:hypothetical protein